MIMCFGRIIGTKSILNLRTMFISLTRSFQSLRESPKTFEILNSSKQFYFQKQAEQIAYPAIFLIDNIFLCFSLFRFSSIISSPASLSYFSFSFSFISDYFLSWCIIFKIVKNLAVATSIIFWFNLRTKQQSEIIFLPFLKFLSKFAYFQSQMPPLSKLFEYRVVNLFSFLSSPQQCMTSLSQLIGCRSTKVQLGIPQTLAPFSSRTE